MKKVFVFLLIFAIATSLLSALWVHASEPPLSYTNSELILMGLVIWPRRTEATQNTAVLQTSQSPCNTPTPTTLNGLLGPEITTPYPPPPTATPFPSATPCATATPWTITPSSTPGSVTPSPTPTATPTTSPVFTATVGVIPNAPLVTVGDSLTVTVTLDVSQGCQLPVYELTLSQVTAGDPPFAPGEPIVLGPGVQMPQTITFTAVTTGTATFRARIYGERYCGDYWNWIYVWGDSIPVTVAIIPPTPPPNLLHMPILRRD